jgi:hypothetical protein
MNPNLRTCLDHVRLAREAATSGDTSAVRHFVAEQLHLALCAIGYEGKAVAMDRLGNLDFVETPRFTGGKN